MDTVYREAVDGKCPVYTYGPIIHNEEVIADLERKGVHVIDTLAAARNLPKGTIVIRSHGVTRKDQENLAAIGHNIVDATCPFVKKIHHLVEKFSNEGYFIIIIGSASHPEVQGIVGWSNPERTVVIGSEKEAQNLTLNDSMRVCIVAQTTFNYNKFQDLVEIIRKKGYDREDMMKKKSGHHSSQYHLQCHTGTPGGGKRTLRQGGCNAGHWRDKQFQYTQAV